MQIKKNPRFLSAVLFLISVSTSCLPIADEETSEETLHYIDKLSVLKITEEIPAPYCGDGTVDILQQEQCDDGNSATEVCLYGKTSCTVCNAECQEAEGDVSFCGDGIVDGFNKEECDSGLSNPSTDCSYGDVACTVCNSTCHQVAGATSFCGDSNLDPIEQCDDGNTITETCSYGLTSCTVCNSACQQIAGATSFCGDGILEPGPEQCDDGNSVDFDGCNTSCNFAPETMGEVGTIVLSSATATVLLLRTYQNPIVFLSPPSYNGTDVAVARITQVGSNFFDVNLQEPEYLDGSHVNETLFYMVLEKGLWQLEDGLILQVDTVDTDRIVQNGTSHGTAIQISVDGAFTQRPSILTQVQTSNDTQFVGTRHRHISNFVFEISMHHQEISTTTHNTETIGWVAFQNGQGTWSFLDYEIATQSSFRHFWKSLVLTNPFTTNSVLLASLASLNGADPGFLRYQLSLPNAQILVQEDESRDAETNHINEDVSFIVFSNTGPLWAWPL
ncbi:MAG: DUF4215 domain-containing protein [Myxococcota bacterium]